MRLTASGGIAAAAIALVTVLAGCSHGGPDGRAAAATARAQVVPVAQELYRTLFTASAQSVAVLDGDYVRCRAGKTKLYYSVSLRLSPFTDRNASFNEYRDRVVSLVRGDGWTLQQRPGPPISRPSPGLAYYFLSKRVGKVTLPGTLGLFGDENPTVGVGGTISVNSPCFDAGGAAGNLQGHPVDSPLAGPSTSPSHS